MLLRYILLCVLYALISPLNAVAAPSFSDVEKQWIANNPMITVVHDKDWKPYSYVDEGKSVGFTIDLMQLISEKSNLNLTLTSGPWKEVYHQIEAGEADVILDIIKTPERAKTTFLFTDSYAKNPNAIVIKNNRKFKKISDLKGKKVAFVASSFIQDFLIEHHPDIIPTPYTDSLSALKALQFDHVDAVISRIVVANQLISEYALFDLSVAAELPTEKLDLESMRIGVRKELPILHSIIAKSMKQINKEEFQYLQDKWLNINQKSSSRFTDNFAYFIASLVAFIFFILFIPIILNKYISDKAITKINQNKMLLVSSVVIFIILSVISFITYFALNKIELQTRTKLQVAISGVNKAINTNLDMWVTERTNYVKMLSTDRTLLPMVIEALTVPPTKKSIKQSMSLIDLRVFFASQQAMHGDIGFFIISKDRINIASMRDENLGEINLIHLQRPTLLDDVFNGQARFIPPVASDINHAASLFFAAPIINDKGEVIAAMTLRSNPSFEFSRLFSPGRIGETGESYAFDDSGNIISTLRFEDKLKAFGQLTAEQNAILQVNMNVPNVDLFSIDPLNASFSYGAKALSFTRSKIEKNGGSTTSYKSYLGRSVLGSWVWNETLQMGFVTEMSEDEALKSYITTRNIIITLLVLTVLLAVSLTALSLWLGRRTQRILLQSNEQLEENVKERTARLSSIVDTALDGIIVLDNTGAMMEFSPAAEHIFGYSKTEVLGEHFAQFFESECQNDPNWLDGALKETHINGLEIEAIHKNGQLLPLEVSIAQATLQKSRIFTCIVRDISERKQVQLALEHAKEQAEEATKSKSDFLANMSHEIRTPMNAIIGMSYLALQTELNTKQHDYVTKILNASNSLLGILNDILDFSKIEAGKFDIETIPFALEEVMSNLSNLLLIKTQEKGLEFLIYTDPKLPQSFKGDPLRIGQILTNLVSNAVKFTDEGEIVVKAELKNEDNDAFYVNFTVRDSGIGMTEQQVAKLFNAFTQADSSTTRKFGGTGLGLTISKNLVEMMQGEISCHSEPSVGSTFSFVLRLEKDITPQTRKDITLPCELKNMKVLIVDDSPDSVEILHSLIHSFGLISHTENNGISALSEIMKADKAGESYDLLLLDYHMPHLNGIDTIESIEKLNLRKPPRIIMVSAYGQDHIRKQNSTVHFDDFLSKPITSSSLFDSISSVYQLNKKQSVVTSNNTDLDSAKLDSKVMGANILLVEDNEINQQVATELLMVGGVNLTIANNGKEAIDCMSECEFDLVLMDIQMPIMDGYQATHYIRNTLENTEIPIVAMTANAMKEDIAQCMDSGMNDHVAKPIEPHKLYAALNHWIAKQDRTVTLPVSNENARENEDLPIIEGFDVKAALARMAGNKNAWHKALRNAVTSQASLSKKLVEAIKNQEEDAMLFAHTMKGVFGNLGCSTVYELAKNIEQQQRDQRSTPLSEVKYYDQQVNLALDRVSEYLSHLEKDPIEAEIAPEESQQLLIELEVLLTNFDMEAIELSEKLYAANQSTDLKHLNDAIAMYDFDSALDILKKIKQTT